MQEHRYRAFLCYSHRDSAWADWLHDALETYAIPPRLIGLATAAGTIPPHLRPVFRDRDELPSASDLSAKVRDALAQSACLIVICSPHAAQSRWVDEEVRTFQRLGRGDRIYCLIVDGEPGASAWPGREHDECLPAALKSRDDGAGPNAETIEPIAADARPSGDGKANAKLKLIAGLLGVGLDDLRHRERRRRRWRRLIAGAAALALLCLTTTLAVNAVIARHAAERRQKQAEDLVGFMLGDLDDKLRRVNRLDILESVADKVVKYFATLPPVDMTGGALAQRTRAQLKLGAVYRDQGRVREAFETFGSALSASEELVRRAPDNAEYEAIHAEGLTWIGLIDWSQGRLDEALARFVAARDVLLRASAQRPDDTDLFDRIGSVYTNAGRIFEARGEMAKARSDYSKVLETYSLLNRREPDILEWKTELGYAHSNLARLAMKEGRFEEAVREYVVDRDIKTNLFRLDPANNERREDLGASEASLGNVLYLCGETKAAESHLRSAMENVEALLQVDPESTDWLDEAGSHGTMLARALRALGNRSEAEESDKVAISRLARLVRKDRDNVGWQRKLALAYAEEARLALDGRQLVAANRAALAAAAALAIAGNPDDLANQLAGAEIQLVTGDIADAAGDPAKARDIWTAAKAAIVAQAAASKNPVVQGAWIGVELRLGELANASALAHALMNDGYRNPDFTAVVEKYGIAIPARGAIGERIAQLANRPSSPETSTD
jgi:tetratricopeptide (TPR) repeat protein